MPDEHEHAGEVNESEEVFDLVLPSSYESAIVLQPSEESFDLPATAVASQWTAILSFPFAVRSIGRDHLDAVIAHLGIECI